MHRLKRWLINVARLSNVRRTSPSLVSLNLFVTARHSSYILLRICVCVRIAEGTEPSEHETTVPDEDTSALTNFEDDDEEDCEDDSSADDEPVWESLKKVDADFRAFLGERMQNRAAQFFHEMDCELRRVNAEVRFLQLMTHLPSGTLILTLFPKTGPS